VETRKVIARLANCIKALARNFIPLTDTTIMFSYEASKSQEISSLIDPHVADEIAQVVLIECREKMVEM
jgi:exosome complex component RRP4